MYINNAMDALQIFRELKIMLQFCSDTDSDSVTELGVLLLSIAW